jgi:hypothetical protein
MMAARSSNVDFFIDDPLLCVVSSYGIEYLGKYTEVLFFGR